MSSDFRSRVSEDQGSSPRVSFCRAFIAAEREFLRKWSREFPFVQQGQVRGDESRTGGFGRGAGQGGRNVRYRQRRHGVFPVGAPWS